MNHLFNSLAAPLCNTGSFLCQPVSLQGIVGILLDRPGQLFHAGGRLLKRCGLLLGTGAEVGVADEDLARAKVDFLDPLADRRNGRGEALLHASQRCKLDAYLVLCTYFNALRQIAGGNTVKVCAGLTQWPQHNTIEEYISQDGNDYRGNDTGTHEL